VAEFLAQEEEPPVALLGDSGAVVVPESGFVILGGRGGRGKTTLTNDMGLHLASGVDWLGFRVPRPLRVLLIENEGPKAAFREKLRNRRDHWEHELRGALFIRELNWGTFALDDDADRKDLRAFAEEQDIDLVIGDPLGSLGMRGAGGPDDVRAFFKLLIDTGLHEDLAWWLLHHPRKVNEYGDPLDELSGDWGGKPDTVLLIDRLGEGRSRLRFPKVRWARSELLTLILALESESEAFTVVGEERADDRDLLAEIADLLTDGRWRTVREIAGTEGIGAREGAVGELLEQHPDRFVSRTGEDAKALGRSPRACLWQLAENDERDPDLFDDHDTADGPQKESR
jgi:hypothetical protein